MFDLTLSFDNGPEPGATPAVLEVLARRSVRATFFVIGKKLAEPERHALAERALAQCRAQPWTLMVLHDLPTGAMRHLDRFLDTVGAAGARIRQDFPPACVPIVEGVPVLPLDDYVAAQPAASQLRSESSLNFPT